MGVAGAARAGWSANGRRVGLAAAGGGAEREKTNHTGTEAQSEKITVLWLVPCWWSL
jgi:hypothetical protein